MASARRKYAQACRPGSRSTVSLWPACGSLSLSRSCEDRAALGVEAVGLGHHLDQGGLSRAVLAHEDRHSWRQLEALAEQLGGRGHRGGPCPKVAVARPGPESSHEADGAVIAAPFAHTVMMSG
jgi:hypothetical protein